MQVAQQFLAALARDWDRPLNALKDHLSRGAPLSARRPTTHPPHAPRKVEITMKTPPIVSLPEWEAARQQLLVKEKEVTRARDALAAERRRMPWLAVEKRVRSSTAAEAGRACPACSRAAVS